TSPIPCHFRISSCTRKTYFPWRLSRGQAWTILRVSMPILLRSLILVAVCLAWSACSRQPEAAYSGGNGAETDGGSFQTAIAEARRVERTLAVTGSLLPLDQTPVSVKVAGRLDHIAVDLGTLVKEGDLV